MAIEGITENAGVVTFDRFVTVKGDLKVVTDLNVTGNVAVSGNLLAEDTITEDTPTVKKTFALIVPTVPLYNGAHCYTVAPCALHVVAMHAVISAVIDEVIGDPPKLILAVEPSETLLVGNETSVIGDVFSVAFVTPAAVAELDSLEIESNGTAVTTGSVNVTLICEEV